MTDMGEVGVYAAELGLVVVVPPSSPAPSPSGKDLDCHKGLGGVFCVSGPRC